MKKKIQLNIKIVSCEEVNKKTPKNTIGFSFSFFPWEWSEIPPTIRESLTILHSSSQGAEIKVTPQERRRKWEMILVTTGRCYFSVGIYSGTIIRVWVFFLTMVPLALCQDKNCERFYFYFYLAECAIDKEKWTPHSFVSGMLVWVSIFLYFKLLSSLFAGSKQVFYITFLYLFLKIIHSLTPVTSFNCWRNQFLILAHVNLTIQTQSEESLNITIKWSGFENYKF